MIPSDILLTLVESVGRREDAEFYLRLFQKLPKHSFAIVAPDEAAIDEAGARLALDLRFLAHLGLFAPIVIGLTQTVDAEARADAVSRELGALKVKSRRYAAHAPRLVERIKVDLEENRIPVVAFSDRAPTLFSRFTLLGEWARRLAVRKLVLVRARGGMGPHVNANLELSPEHQLLATERGISLVNLRRDHAALMTSNTLDGGDRELLLGIREAMQGTDLRPEGPQVLAADALVTSVIAPVNLLHELFTVKGAGTLIRSGSLIETHKSYQSVDRARLEALLTATFGRVLKPSFFERPPTAVYIEQGYLGAAVVSASENASFLTKFVVDRLAQGLGIGRDLWEAVTRDHERLFWRARPQNPITQWYQAQCQGMVRTPQWNVYFRGVDHRNIPTLIDEALQLPPDFES